MLSRLSRIRYQCDACGTIVDEDRAEGEESLLPLGWHDRAVEVDFANGNLVDTNRTVPGRIMGRDYHLLTCCHMQGCFTAIRVASNLYHLGMGSNISRNQQVYHINIKGDQDA